MRDLRQAVQEGLTIQRKTPEERQAIREARGEKFKEPPLFTETAIAGKCPKCSGSQFRAPLVSRWSGPLIYTFFEARKLVECVTCGKRFTKG